jgi:Zn-dependent protease with chaperone function
MLAGAGKTKRGQFARFGALLILGALALLVAGCDEDQIEKQLGQATAASIEQTYKVNDDPLLADWCAEVGRTLTAFSTRQQVPYSFKVIDTDMVNAFAAPWGYVYVTQGLLDFADTEDEVVAVLGHEIGHVVHRDGIKSLKRSLLYALAAALIGGKSETLGDVTSLGLGLLSLHYSRENEYAADDSGTLMAYSAGYNPQGLLDFFDKLHREMEKGRPSSILDGLLATHPYTPNRKLRQQEHDWVTLAGVGPTMRVAQGYLRRGAYGQALNLLRAASSRAPDDAQLSLMLADALAGRGAIGEARQAYQVAMARSSGAYPRLALAALDTLPAVVSSPPDAAERQQAAALVASARETLSAVAQAVSLEATRQRTLTQRLARAREDSGAAMDALHRLANVEVDLPPASQRTVVHANAAINTASEVIYTLDQYQKLAEQTVTWNAQIAQMAKAYLEAVGQGKGRSGTLPLVESALRHLGRAGELLAAGADLAQEAVGPAQRAQEAARQTSQYVEYIMGKRKTRTSDLFAAQELTRETKQRAVAAMKPAQEANRQARKASIRGTLAALQLAQAQAPAEMLPGLDRLVAHYLRTTPGQVSLLRDRGLGYGDIVVILAVAKDTGTAPSVVAEQVAEGPSAWDRVQMNRHAVDALKVMTKWLSRAMFQELGMKVSKDLPA